MFNASEKGGGKGSPLKTMLASCEFERIRNGLNKSLGCQIAFIERSTNDSSECQ